MDQKLDFNTIEVRGLFMLQQNVMSARQQAEQARVLRDTCEQEAAEALKGRVPEGTSILDLRIDQRAHTVFLNPKPAAAQPAP